MSSTFVKSTQPTVPILLTAEDLDVPNGWSRKRSPTSSTTPAAKKTRVCSQIEDISVFVTSKRTAPQIFAGKRKTEDNLKVFPGDKENQPVIKKEQKKVNDDEKLSKILEKSRTRPVPSSRRPLNLPPTMVLREALRAQNLKEAEDMKKNGPAEPAKKKKKAARRNDYWKQFK